MVEGFAGGDGVEVWVVVVVEALGFECCFCVGVEGSEEDVLRGEEGSVSAVVVLFAEGAEQIRGPGEHAAVYGDDGEGVVCRYGVEVGGLGGGDGGCAGCC